MNKKVIASCIAVSACLALVLPSAAFASQNHSESARGCNGSSGLVSYHPGQDGGFVDLDGDGVCDLKPSGSAGIGNGQAACSGFADVDADGICDNAGQGASGDIQRHNNANGVCNADGRHAFQYGGHRRGGCA